MPSPTEGNRFYTTEKRPLTFVCGFNITSLVKAGKMVNLSLSANNVTSFNNTDITVADNGTGTVQVTPTFNNAGRFTAQFKFNDANYTYVSPLFTFDVSAPVTAF